MRDGSGGTSLDDDLGHDEVDHPARAHEHGVGGLVGRSCDERHGRSVNTWVPAPMPIA